MKIRPMTDILREFDWSKTPPGDLTHWSPAIRNCIKLCMHSKSANLVMVGEELIAIYNQAYAQIIDRKHPEAFGAPIKNVWPELWESIGPMLKSVLREGKSFVLENHPFTLNRKGYPEECYFTFSYSPIYNDDENIEGIFASITETTQIVHNVEHLRSLRNQQLKNLFIQAPIAMCILTGPDLIVEVANEKMLELWGKSSEQMISRPLFVGLPDARNQGFEDLLNGVYTTGNRVVLEEVPVNLLRKGKTESVFVKLVYEALREPDGKVSGIMVLADEITEQVNNRKKIEESEARLRLAIESTKLGTWDFNPITGELTWSDECKKIYDFPAGDSVNFEMFSRQIFPPDKAFVEAAVQKAMDPREGNYDITYRIMRFSDASVRWIKATGKVFFTTQNQAERFIGTVIDVTEQKLLEEKLRESEMRVRLAIEASEMGTFDWDIPNSTFHYSDRLAQMFGYVDTKNLLQKNFGDRIHPDDQEMRLKAHEAAFRNGTLFYEVRTVWPDSSIHWVRLNGKVIYDEKGAPARMYGTTLNITDQKMHAEKLEKEVTDRTAKLEQQNISLTESEERYHKMVEEVQDYAIILLDKEGMIQNWNKGAEKIKQYSENEVKGKHFSIFYFPGDQKNNLPQNLITQAIENGRSSHEGWRKRKDGSRFWGSVTITALHGANNDVIGFSKVTRDLTDKKVAEDKLLLYTKELESQNSELEQFAYVASHDLQEPLRKIQTFSEIIQENINDHETVKKYFAKINNSAHRMAELIKSVLNYSKLAKDEVAAVDVDLNKIVSDVELDFELLINDKHAVINYNNLPTIKGNPLQFNQLFANLIGNSLKFTEKNPTITIKSKIVQKSELLNAPDFLPETYYSEISFSDNGIGFDQKYERQIFTMFQRLHSKQQYAGTGIGLALCKKIVENHNGHIAAKGELGKGSTFYVYLPLAPSRAK